MNERDFIVEVWAIQLLCKAKDLACGCEEVKLSILKIYLRHFVIYFFFVLLLLHKKANVKAKHLPIAT